MKENKFRYSRFCKRCGSLFKKTSKYQKICEGCKKGRGNRARRVRLQPMFEK